MSPDRDGTASTSFFECTCGFAYRHTIDNAPRRITFGAALAEEEVNSAP
jgi:hypothetical protein